MSLFPVITESVQIGTAAPAGTDTYRNGVQINATDTLVRGSLSAGAQFSNGLAMTTAGQFTYVDATAGLPAGTQWTNGLPMSNGAVCISTGAAATYSNGLPFAANGAMAATITP